MTMKTRYLPTEIFHLGGWNLLENRRDEENHFLMDFGQLSRLD